MAAIEAIREYLISHGVDVPRVLLVCGGRFKNALGDTVNFAYHFRYLTAAFGRIQPTVWGSDQSVWRTLCGDGVSCRPFLAEAEATQHQHIVVFDWVTVDAEIERLYESSSAVLLEVPAGPGWARYRLRGAWQSIPLPPKVSHSRRVQDVYHGLGINTSPSASGRGPAERTRCVETNVYLTPYGSSAEKCLNEPLLSDLIAALTVQLSPTR